MSLYHIEQANLPLEIIQLLSFLSSLLSLQANRERERERERNGLKKLEKHSCKFSELKREGGSKPIPPLLQLELSTFRSGKKLKIPCHVLEHFCIRLLETGSVHTTPI